MKFYSNERNERNESGFTIIELCVTIGIIGIIALIAIPNYLAQRKSGWVGAVKSDINNTVIFIEQNKEQLGGYKTYPGPPPGSIVSKGVSLKVYGSVDTKTKSSCVEAFYTASPTDTVWSYSIAKRKMSEGKCNLNPIP